MSITGFSRLVGRIGAFGLAFMLSLCNACTSPHNMTVPASQPRNTGYVLYSDGLRCVVSLVNDDICVHITLQNKSDRDIVVDRDLVCCIDIEVRLNERPAEWEYYTIAPIGSAAAQARLVTLRPGEQLSRTAYLRKGHEVLSASRGIGGSGSQAHMATAYLTGRRLAAEEQLKTVALIIVRYEKWSTSNILGRGLLPFLGAKPAELHLFDEHLKAEVYIPYTLRYDASELLEDDSVEVPAADDDSE